jgi:hypothetical protein
VALFREAVNGLKLGGGGGEGESSLDGIAEAADGPFRESSVRVLLLVTDGGPKRADGRMRGAAETVKYLKEKRIDQLHVVALPDHRKAFEPLWEGAKGQYLDLSAANATGDYAKLLADLGRTVCAAIPEPPANKPEPSGPAPVPVLPQVATVALPALPPGPEPVEPKVEKAVPPTVTEAVTAAPAEKSPASARSVFVVGAWVFVVAIFMCAALLIGQMTILPGGLPLPNVGAAGYGSGLVLGLVFAAAGYFAMGAVGGGFVGRLAGGLGLGLGMGVLVPIGARIRRESSAQEQPLELPPDEPVDPVPPPPLPAWAEEPKVAPTIPAFKPVITAPTKPRDGCPGCGRTIPGDPGLRYCMLCDTTF